MLNEENEKLTKIIKDLNDKYLQIENNLSDAIKCKDEFLNQLDVLNTNEEKNKKAILDYQNDIYQLKSNVLKNEDLIKVQSLCIENSNKEITSLKADNHKFDELRTKLENEKGFLEEKIIILTNDMKLFKQEEMIRNEDLKSKYQDQIQKRNDLEEKIKSLISIQNEVTSTNKILKDSISHLIDIITTYNSSNIELSKKLFSNEINNELHDNFNKINELISLGDKDSVYAQLKCFIMKSSEQLSNKVQQSNDFIKNIVNLKESSLALVDNLQNSLDHLLSILISNQKVYSESYKISPFHNLDKSISNQSLIEQILSHQHKTLSNHINCLTNEIENFSKKNDENIKDIQLLKKEKTNLNCQIENLNKEIEFHKEHSQSFVNKLNNHLDNLFVILSDLGIIIENPLIRNEEFVLFDHIKNYLQLISNEISNLKEKDSINDNSVFHLLTLIYKSNNFNLFSKGKDLICKNNMISEQNTNLIKKHEDFVVYNIDKEIEFTTKLKDILQAKEKECTELTQHLENIKTQHKNEKEKEIERIILEYKEKMRKIEKEKQLFLEEKKNEIKDILEKKQTEFDLEKQKIIKNEDEKYKKLIDQKEEKLKKEFEFEKHNLEKILTVKFEEEKKILVNNFNSESEIMKSLHLKKMSEMENNYNKILQSKDDEFINLNQNFKIDLKTIKNQIASKDKELKEISSKYNNLLKSNESNDLLNIQSKEIDSLTKRLKECLENTIPNLQLDTKSRKESCELLNSEVQKLVNENLLLKNQLVEFENKNLLIEKEIQKIKEISESSGKKEKELNRKNEELKNDNNDLSKELLLLKNKLSDIDNQSKKTIEDMNREIKIINEEKFIFLSFKEKIEKKIKTILIIISPFDDKNSEDKFIDKDKDIESIDEYSNLIYKNLDDITRITNYLIIRLKDLERLEANKNEEKILLEQKLVDQNKKAEDKINELTEENQKLRNAILEYSRNMIEAMNKNSDFLLVNNNLNSSNLSRPEEIYKPIDLFKCYNQEMNKLKSDLENNIIKAIEKGKKYKEFYKEKKGSDHLVNKEINHPCFYDPKKYLITYEKNYNNLKWFLLVLKKNDSKILNSSDAIWILSTNIKEDLYEKMKDNTIEQSVGKSIYNI